MFTKYAKLSGFLSLASISVLLLGLSACGGSGDSNQDILIQGDGSIQGIDYTFLEVVKSSKTNYQNITLSNLNYTQFTNIFFVSCAKNLTNNANLLIKNSRGEYLSAIDSETYQPFKNLNIINNKNITVKDSFAKESLNVIDTDGGTNITNNGNLTIIHPTLTKNKEAEIVNLTFDSHLINKGNLYVKDANNTAGVKLEVSYSNNSSMLDNQGVISISSDSYNSCGIKIDSSSLNTAQKHIKSIGTIALEAGKSYSDLSKAWNASADKHNNKPICHK